MQEEHSIADLCAALAVSRSGYHAWAARAPGPRAQANAVLWPLIQQAYEASRQTYGSPRIRQWLGRRGQKCSRHRVARLMRRHRMASQTKRRFRVALTDSRHDLPIAPHRLRDIAPPTRRDAVWVADITYVDTAEGWFYVAAYAPVRGLGHGRHASHEPALGGAGHGAATSPAGRPAAWSTIQIEACNTPAPPTGNA